MSKIKKTFTKINQKWFPLELIIIVAFFTLLRFSIIDTQNPEWLIFDEKYYIPQSIVMTTIPDDGETQFGEAVYNILPEELGANSFTPEDGETLAELEESLKYNYNTHYHPLLGKLLIGLGINKHEPTDSSSWRLSAGIAYILIGVFVMLTTKLILKNNIPSLLTGILFYTDGQALSQSRIGMLDIFLTLFLIITTYTVIIIYKNTKTYKKRILWNILTGTLIGLMLSIKWNSSIYAIIITLFILLKEFKLSRNNNTTNTRKILLSLVSPVTIFITSMITYITIWFHPSFWEMNRINGFFNKLSFLYEYHLKSLQELSKMSDDAYPGYWLKKWVLQSKEFYYYEITNNTYSQYVEISGNKILWIGIFISIIASIILWKKLSSNLNFLITLFISCILTWLILTNRHPYTFYTIQLLPIGVITLSYYLYAGLKHPKLQPATIFLLITIIISSAIMLPSWV